MNNISLTVLHVSASGKSALVNAVTFDSSGIGGHNVLGWVPVNKSFEKDEVVETSFTSVDTRVSKAEDGSEFTWLVLS